MTNGFHYHNIFSHPLLQYRHIYMNTCHVHTHTHTVLPSIIETLMSISTSAVGEAVFQTVITVHSRGGFASTNNEKCIHLWNIIIHIGFYHLKYMLRLFHPPISYSIMSSLVNKTPRYPPFTMASVKEDHKEVALLFFGKNSNKAASHLPESDFSPCPRVWFPSCCCATTICTVW